MAVVEEKPPAGEQKPGEQKPGEQPVGEQKPGEQKPGEQGKEGEQKPGEQKPGEQKPPSAPEKYALTIPDDVKDFVDADVLGSVEGMARKAGWSNEEAQAAVAEHGRLLREANDGFLTQLKADPDYGGEKLVETQRLAKSAIDLLRPEGHPRREAFIRAVNRVAAGNHPEVVSFLADLGRRAAEDSIGQQAGGAGGKKKTAEEALYGDSSKK